MEFFPSVEREFDAGHHVPGDSRCGYEGHGHRWRVRVTVKGSFNTAKGISFDTLPLEKALDETIGEIRGRSLNAMLPAAAAVTPEGLGTWFLERLLPLFKQIVEVTVWLDPQHAFSIRRESR